MKYTDLEKQAEIVKVAPYTGAWIEIKTISPLPLIGLVAPYTGAWIEMVLTGLRHRSAHVAPNTGAWIEMEKWLESSV